MINVREEIGRMDDHLPEMVRKIPEFGVYYSVLECEIQDYELLYDGYFFCNLTERSISQCHLPTS
jgi:hypothetical protein